MTAPDAARPAEDVEDVLSLAAEIRRVDGAHDLGAAALAEALKPWFAQLLAQARAEGAAHGMRILAGQFQQRGLSEAARRE